MQGGKEMKHHFRDRKGKKQRGRYPATDQKVSRVSTDEKVLWGIWAVSLMGVVYSLWISMQVVSCCR
jgi:hypothetical protein